MDTTSSKPNPRLQRRYKVEVTQEQIDGAVRNDSKVCAVATAIAAAIPDAHRIQVDSNAIRFSRGRNRFVYLNPPAVEYYVIGFDAGDNLRPFSFRLDESRLIPIKTRPVTPAGRTVDSVRARAGRRATSKAKAAGGTPKDIREARNVARRKAYEKTRATVEGPLYTSTDGRRPPPPSRARSYGHRVMRINQGKASMTPPAETSPVETPPAVVPAE